MSLVALLPIIIFVIFDILLCSFFFFFNDTATTEIYTLSLHDALPISVCFCPALFPAGPPRMTGFQKACPPARFALSTPSVRDRKSTRLNSSHSQISYAVFCLKKKKKTKNINYQLNVDRTVTDTQQ